MRRSLRAVVPLLAIAASLGPVASSARAADLPDPVACDGCYAPALQTSWQWQLQGTVDTSVDVELYDIDGFEASASLVQDLHDAGRKVVCYLDAGSWEDFRPDAGDFPDRVLGRSNGWPGERWLDVRRLRVLRPIMEARLDLCDTKGFDAVEFDNVDGYRNRTGFPLTGADQLRYDVFLANQAHLRGLSAVLKNDLGEVRTLLPYFDFALDEQCFQYHECDKLTPFVDAGKAVFGVEYHLDPGDFCPDANAMDFNFLKKKLSLRAWRVACR